MTESIAERINRLHAEVAGNVADSRNALNSAIKAAWEAGGLLIEELPHRLTPPKGHNSACWTLVFATHESPSEICEWNKGTQMNEAGTFLRFARCWIPK